LEKLEIVSGHADWDQEKLFDKKTKKEKSRDTIPLSPVEFSFKVLRNSV
jgi:hypothetical protein